MNENIRISQGCKVSLIVWTAESTHLGGIARCRVNQFSREGNNELPMTRILARLVGFALPREFVDCYCRRVVERVNEFFR